MNNITSSQILEIISTTINEDILTLNAIKSEFINNKIEFDFINSLIDGKMKIKEALPERSEGNKETVSTPLHRVMKSYADIKQQLEEDQNRLPKICFEVEESQRDFIKDQYALKGIPDELQNKLGKVLEIYNKIYDHLKRSKSTSQLGTIQV